MDDMSNFRSHDRSLYHILKFNSTIAEKINSYNVSYAYFFLFLTGSSLTVFHLAVPYRPPVLPLIVGQYPSEQQW